MASLVKRDIMKAYGEVELIALCTGWRRVVTFMHMSPNLLAKKSPVPTGHEAEGTTETAWERLHK